MQKQEFLQLVDKYLKGHANDEEEQLLLNFFESFQTDDDWGEAVLGAKQQLEDKMLHRLHNAINLHNRQQHRGTFNLLKPRKLVTAIVAIAVIATGTYYILKNHTKQALTAANKPVIKHDVDPGKNTAILTLDNGEQVVLDSAKIGTVAKKGKISIKKTRDGQVIYTVDKSGAQSADEKIAYNTISTPRGGQYQVILPDGTKVWLNAASSLKFPTAFAGNQRNVELNGEAYFEVAKNRAKPFNVKVNAMNVNVLGTHFNIMAYNNDDAMKTTLLEGSVQLINGALRNYLKPGEQGIVKGNDVSVISVDADKAIAWKNGYFEFDRASIQDIMKQLSRWYDTEVTYEGKMPDDEFVGRIGRDVKLSQVLHVLQLSHVHFRIENKKIIVTP